MHPSGHHVLVGFADKLRIMNVLDNDIKPYAEFSIKACREVRFSQGGQTFAAANGATIQIYNTYTCENLANLRGHNGKVRCILRLDWPRSCLAQQTSPSVQDFAESGLGA